jgi:hypothetical protein
MTMRERALQLRDIALDIVRQRGSLEPTGDGGLRLLVFRDGDLGIALRTPFQRPPPVPEAMKYWAAMTGRHVDLPYGLDVWFPKKVLNVEWADDGRAVIVCFRRGEWERRLEALAGNGRPGPS